MKRRTSRRLASRTTSRRRTSKLVTPNGADPCERASSFRRGPYRDFIYTSPAEDDVDGAAWDKKRLGLKRHLDALDEDCAELVERERAAKHRVSKRLRENAIPPAPDTKTTGRHAPDDCGYEVHPDYESWVTRTFAPGVRVRFRHGYPYGVDMDTDVRVPVPAGTVGTVRKFYRSDSRGLRCSSVNVVFTLDSPLFFSSTVQNVHVDVPYDDIRDLLEPLDDNWGAQTVPMRRPMKGRRMLPNGGKRRVSHRGGSDLRRIEEIAREAGWAIEPTRGGHMIFRSPDKSVPLVTVGGDPGDYRVIKHIETALRRSGLETSPRRVRRNVTPSVPEPFAGNDRENWYRWVGVTYAPGTPVKFADAGYVSWQRDHDYYVPGGARGVVIENEDADYTEQVQVQIVDARHGRGFEMGQPDEGKIGMEISVKYVDLSRVLEPLVDNWAGPRSSRRLVVPRRVTTGVRRTSRRVRP